MEELEALPFHAGADGQKTFSKRQYLDETKQNEERLERNRKPFLWSCLSSNKHQQEKKNTDDYKSLEDKL